MENRQDQNSDISKSQSAQQPQASEKDRLEEQRKSAEGGLDQSQSQTGSDASKPSTGQAGFGESQSDTKTDQRSDIEGNATDQTSDTEGSSATGQASGSPGFVGAEGTQDTSSELVEDADKDDFAKDGQGSVE